MYSRNFNSGSQFDRNIFAPRRSMFKAFFVLVVILTVGALVFNTTGAFKTETVLNCKVERLVQQQVLDGNKGTITTGYRYLVITNKETFICESSLLNGKFNNSDIFWRLKEGEAYDFKVMGYGKTFITDYRNILDANKVNR